MIFQSNSLIYNFVKCTGGTRDEMTGSSSDDWILLALRLQPVVINPHLQRYRYFHTLYIHRSTRTRIPSPLVVS
jgi:hypothetical protein